jgi:hypothetical protein
MGKFKTAAMKKKTVWPAFPSSATIEEWKNEVLARADVQANGALEIEKGNHWMAMAIGQLPDGKLVTFITHTPTKEESRAERRAYQQTLFPVRGGPPLVFEGTPFRYIGSWNFGFDNLSYQSPTVPQS